MCGLSLGGRCGIRALFGNLRRGGHEAQPVAGTTAIRLPPESGKTTSVEVRPRSLGGREETEKSAGFKENEASHQARRALLRAVSGWSETLRRPRRSLGTGHRLSDRRVPVFTAQTPGLLPRLRAGPVQCPLVSAWTCAHPKPDLPDHIERV